MNSRAKERAACWPRPRVAEADAFVAQLKDLKLPDGRDRIVRHGYGPERTIQTGIGAVAVRRAKVRDREEVIDAEKVRNGSLRISRKDTAQQSTAGAELRSGPHLEGAVCERPLGRPSSAALFLFRIFFDRISLTNGESISTLFRVGRRLHLPWRGVLYSWLTPTADR